MKQNTHAFCDCHHQVNRKYNILLKQIAGMFLLIQTITISSNADSYHYRNVLVGERAAGLAGAFTAVSDDPSGIFYNPAGLAFITDDYISLSGNAINVTQEEYKDIVPGQNYTLQSQGIVPAFFGFTQTLFGKRVGFAVAVPNADLLDQDDELTNISTADKGPNLLRRRFFFQDTLYNFGPGISQKFGDRFSIGLTLFGFFRLVRAIDNQTILFNPLGTGQYYLQTSSFSTYSFGLEPKLGTQFMITEKWAIGFTASRKFNIWGKGKIRQQYSNTDPATGLPVTFNGSYSNDNVYSYTENVTTKLPENYHFTLGNAYFFSKSFLVSTDLDFHTGYIANSVYPTWDLAIGSELFLSESFPIRLGAFTANSNSKTLDSNLANQNPHINNIGLTTGFSILKPGSSFGLGVSAAFGSGKGQIISGSTTQQDAYQRSYGLYFSGSSQL